MACSRGGLAEREKRTEDSTDDSIAQQASERTPSEVALLSGVNAPSSAVPGRPSKWKQTSSGLAHHQRTDRPGSLAEGLPSRWLDLSQNSVGLSPPTTIDLLPDLFQPVADTVSD